MQLAAKQDAHNADTCWLMLNRSILSGIIHCELSHVLIDTPPNIRDALNSPYIHSHLKKQARCDVETESHTS